MPNVKDFSADADRKLYESYMAELALMISESEKVSPEAVFAANSADSLIYRAVYAARPKKAAVTVPNYSACERALLSADCSVADIIVTEEDNFSLPADIASRIPDSAELVYIADPSGNSLSPELLKSAEDRCALIGAYLIIEEYGITHSAGYVPSGRAALIKTVSCSLGGYHRKAACIISSDSAFLEKIRLCGPDEPQLTCAPDDGYKPHSEEYTARERNYIAQCLENLSIKVYPSAADFLLIKTPLPLEHILESVSGGYNIRLSRCHVSDNYNELYRIAVLSHEENANLIYALSRGIFGYLRR